MNWTPLCVLPNIDLDNPIESNLLALVPSSDSRVQQIREEKCNFRQFLGSFTDQFGNTINPALILQNKDTEERKINGELIASFRDIIVASTVPYAIARIINAKPNINPAYSSYFSICPSMIGEDYESIVCSSPALEQLAPNILAKFRGQSSPELSPKPVTRKLLDEPLLQELLRWWQDKNRYKKNPKWKYLALFRSLNMANQAMLIPVNANVAGTFYDYGRIIALWVAAFEILIHQGDHIRANRNKVFSGLFEKYPWIDKQHGHKRFQTKGYKNKEDKTIRINSACWVYDQLNACRNNFLHGNRVKKSDLYLKRSRQPIYKFAPILYRLGLTAFLDLSWKEQFPKCDDSELINVEKRKFEQPQFEAETALRQAASKNFVFV